MRQVILLFVLFFFANSAFGEEPVKLDSPLTDLAHIFSDTEKGELLNQIAVFEKDRGSQLVVLTVNNIGQYAIEDFAYKTFELTHIGRSKTNDGILILVSVQDRKARIEVGRGLEGAVTDVYAKRIIEGVITPNFREQKYYLGISESLKTLSYLIEKEELPPALASQSTPTTFPINLLFPLLIGLSMLRGILSSIFGQKPATLLVSVIAFLIIAVLVTVFWGVLSGIAAYFLLSILPIGSQRYRSFGSNSWNTSGTGWSGGGGSSSGWSGGGGSSGGGGASGSW